MQSRKDVKIIMHFSKKVVKYRIPILILAVLLMIPSVIGMTRTRINYDMLNYLPEDMETVIGQDEQDTITSLALLYLLL